MSDEDFVKLVTAVGAVGAILWFAGVIVMMGEAPTMAATVMVLMGAYLLLSAMHYFDN